MAAPGDSYFLSQVSTLCRDILVFCKDLFGNVYKGCSDEEFDRDVNTCSSACENLRDFVQAFDTPNIAKKQILMHNISLLIVKLKELVPDLQCLHINPNDNGAKQSLQTLRQEFVDVAKNVLLLAKHVETADGPSDIASPGRGSQPIVTVDEPTDSVPLTERESAKRNCLNLLENLSDAISRQDRDEWKEAARSAQ